VLAQIQEGVDLAGKTIDHFSDSGPTWLLIGVLVFAVVGIAGGLVWFLIVKYMPEKDLRHETRFEEMEARHAQERESQSTRHAKEREEWSEIANKAITCIQKQTEQNERIERRLERLESK